MLNLCPSCVIYAASQVPPPDRPPERVEIRCFWFGRLGLRAVRLGLRSARSAGPTCAHPFTRQQESNHSTGPSACPGQRQESRAKPDRWIDFRLLWCRKSNHRSGHLAKSLARIPSQIGLVVRSFAPTGGNLGLGSVHPDSARG